MSGHTNNFALAHDKELRAKLDHAVWVIDHKNKALAELTKKLDLQEKQIDWLVDRLAGSAAKKMGLPKHVMELSIQSELEGMNK